MVTTARKFSGLVELRNGDCWHDIANQCAWGDCTRDRSPGHPAYCVYHEAEARRRREFHREVWTPLELRILNCADDAMRDRPRTACLYRAAGDRLKAAMAAAGVTSGALAAAAGVHISAARAWMRGRNPMAPKYRPAVAEALSIAVSEVDGWYMAKVL